MHAFSKFFLCHFSDVMAVDTKIKMKATIVNYSSASGAHTRTVTESTVNETPTTSLHVV